jgi:hypothetical protein
MNSCALSRPRSLYSNDVDGSLVGLPAQAQARAEDSVGAASAIAGQLPPDAASSLHATSGDAFTQAMGIGLLVAAALAAATAVVVLRFLPAREPDAAQAEGVEPGVRPEFYAPDDVARIIGESANDGTARTVACSSDL